MNVYKKRAIFRRRNESNVYRMFFWVVLLLGGIWLIRLVQQGEIRPLFEATPTPTREAGSYTLEGEALFTAGRLNDTVDANGSVTSIGAITAYKEAVRADPNDAGAWAKLARIQAYSSALLTTDDARRARLEEALESAQKAVELAPDNSEVYAIRAFVLDWNSTPGLVCSAEDVVSKGTCDASVKLLTDAERDAVRALQLDNQNTLALAFYAEILVDAQRWSQAEESIDQALERDSTLMDVHRVHAYVLESSGKYTLAIEAYNRAIAIAPNMTFLYLRAGANYRRLAFDSPNEEIQRQLFEKSLEYFAESARINEQLGVEDPGPYLSIARTYSQTGDYFAAARNAQKALSFRPNDADIYGQLGVIFFKSRNYEGSIDTLRCAVRGCSGEDSCKGRGLEACDDENAPVTVEGLKLSPSSVVYYYTYGSVLAALSRPKQNYCPEALDVFGEVKVSFAGDKDISGIVAAGEEICRLVAQGDVSSDINLEATPALEPVMQETPTPTPVQ